MSIQTIALRDIPAYVQATFRSNQQRWIITGVAGLALTGFTAIARKDYLLYLSYGPGGMPYNIVGWLASTVMKLFRKNTRSPSPYDDPKLPFADEPPWLPENFPSERAGGRPQIGPHPVPQRQLNEIPSDDIRAKFIAAFRKLSEELEQRGLVEVKMSRLERHAPALHVAGGRHVVAEELNGEIAHIHEHLDATVHVTLSPADCKKIFAAQWGERHGFAGVRWIRKWAGFSLPPNYIMIYAPRNEEEIEIVMKVVEASVAFMLGKRDLGSD